MTKEVEDIIKNKAYIELTDNERERVGEWAQNEEEYNNMKWFLMGTASAFSSGKIQASPGLKKGVMKHLTESKKKKGFWLNSVGVFLLPEGKRFYQKPAFQLGIAAVAVVGFLFFFNNNLDESNLALNEQTVPTDTVFERSLDADENNEQLPAQDLESEDALNKNGEAEHEFDMSSNMDQNQHFISENGLRSEGEVDRVFEVPMEEKEEDGYMDYAPAPVIEKAEYMVEEVDDVEEDVTLSVDEIADDEDYRELNEVMLNGHESQLKDSEGTTSLGNAVTMTTGSDDKLLVKRDNAKNKSERTDVERKKRVFKNFAESSDATVADMDEEVSEEEPGAFVEGAAGSNGEWIVPKSMHINKTKELNQLFHIEK